MNIETKKILRLFLIIGVVVLPNYLLGQYHHTDTVRIQNWKGEKIESLYKVVYYKTENEYKNKFEVLFYSGKKVGAEMDYIGSHTTYNSTFIFVRPLEDRNKHCYINYHNGKSFHSKMFDEVITDTDYYSPSYEILKSDGQKYFAYFSDSLLIQLNNSDEVYPYKFDSLFIINKKTETLLLNVEANDTLVNVKNARYSFELECICYNEGGCYKITKENKLEKLRFDRIIYEEVFHGAHIVSDSNRIGVVQYSNLLNYFDHYPYALKPVYDTIIYEPYRYFILKKDNLYGLNYFTEELIPICYDTVYDSYDFFIYGYKGKKSRLGIMLSNDLILKPEYSKIYNTYFSAVGHPLILVKPIARNKSEMIFMYRTKDKRLIMVKRLKIL